MLFTVILTVWKRNNLEKQIEAIKGSSINPQRIIVFQNDSHVDVSKAVAKFDVEHVHARTTNFKYHARFALCLGIDSDFFAIYDDDTIPGAKWHEAGLHYCNSLNAIVGSNGRSFLPNQKIQIASGGVSNRQFTDKATPSDIVGHAWIVKKQHLCNMFSCPITDFTTGEDIHLSLVNKTLFSVDTLVPPQPKNSPELWGDLHPELGLDDHASFKTFVDHNRNRSQLFSDWLARGWKPYYLDRHGESGTQSNIQFQGWISG